jgi:hypothetical protein
VLWQDPRIVIGAVSSAGLAVTAVVILYQRRLTPAEKERRRRVAINKGRRTVEGFITEAGSDLIHFQYELRGVTYFASQDISALHAALPPDPTRLIGAVSVKYDPKNPANSIVLCEEWSGLPVIKEPMDAIENQPG